jgi:hypothetical protein
MKTGFGCRPNLCAEAANWRLTADGTFSVSTGGFGMGTQYFYGIFNHEGNEYAYLLPGLAFFISKKFLTGKGFALMRPFLFGISLR